MECERSMISRILSEKGNLAILERGRQLLVESGPPQRLIDYVPKDTTLSWILSYGGRIGDGGGMELGDIIG